MRQIGINLRRPGGLGAAAAAVQEAARRASGETVLFRGRTLAAVTGIVAEGKVGLQFLGRQALGAYSAKADPRVFSLSPADFDPARFDPAQAAQVAPPAEGRTLVFEGRAYRLTHVADEHVAGAAVALRCFGHRILMASQIEGADAAWVPTAAVQPVFDVETCQLWRPKTLSQLTDAATLKVHDVAFVRAWDAVAFFTPFAPGERLTVAGQMDVRENHVYTDAPLRLGDLLYRPDVQEAWYAAGPSERLAGSALLQAPVRHLQIVPKSVREGQ